MNFFATFDLWGYLGLIMIGLSILITTGSFLQYARRKMTDSFGMIWLLIAVVVMILGITLIVVGYSHMLICAVVCIVCGLLLLLIFILSRMVSDLTMKVRELAMQVALLNQENDSMLQQIRKLKEPEKDA